MLEILHSISQPTLIVEKDRCLRNIREMAAKARASKVIFRPHFKTHQSATVAEWFREEGISCITVSSVAMARYFASHGWTDITIAFPANLRELDEVMLLNRKLRLNVLISSVYAMREIAAKIKEPLHFFIEIDNGYGRSGVPLRETDEITTMIQVADANRNFKFCGFLSHFGNTYSASDQQEIREIFFNGINALGLLKDRFIRNHRDLMISVGDTPSCSVIQNFNGIDEIRPGNFIYYDLMQYLKGVCREDQIAAIVACPVVEVHPERNQFVIYGGAVHFSKDYIVMNGEKIFGCGVNIQKDTWGPPDLSTRIIQLTQEHGVVKCDAEKVKKISPGDIHLFIPVHSCLTANIISQVLTSNGESLDRFR